MSQQASGSRTYRQPAVVDDSDDDLDDLDDVLIAFDAKPAKSAQNTAAAAPPPLPLASSRTPAPSGGVENDDETSFEADLAGEMEALLKQLAGTHIPGPMPDTDDPTDTPSPKPTTDVGGADGEKALSPEAEEAAWQKAIEMMLSGEGMAALGLDKDEKGESSKPRQPPPAAASGSGQPSFDETIRRTMEQLGSKDKRATGDGDVPPDLAALLAKLGEGGDGDEDELGGLLDGMMSQLMTKEVLEEPMAELAAKYPAYLANPPSEISATDLDKYRKQQSLVNQIVTTFRKPSYSDETDGKEIARLVSDMQDLGGPPKEIMGDLPEGLDLGGGEDCCIM